MKTWKWISIISLCLMVGTLLTVDGILIFNKIKKHTPEIKQEDFYHFYIYHNIPYYSDYWEFKATDSCLLIKYHKMWYNDIDTIDTIKTYKIPIEK